MKVDIQQLENCILNQSDPEVFSGVVYLTVGGEVVFQKGYGHAVRSEAIPNQVDTRFQIASGTKVFTAMGILRLIEEHKLSLSTPLVDCINEDLPHFSREITIEHLLTHSSGITSYFEEDINPDFGALWENLPVYRMRSPRDFLPLMADKPAKFPPGSQFEYNDGGFILLGLAIESLTGLRYADYINQAVFYPAGMHDSGFFFADMLPERTAYAYIRNDDGSMRTNFFSVPIIGAPDGGSYTTAPDLARFWKALLGNRLLSVNTVESMVQARIVTNDKELCGYYGYGVWIDKQDAAVSKISIEGYDPGVAFRSIVFPEKDIILTMIGNTSEALWPLYRKIEAILKPC